MLEKTKTLRACLNDKLMYFSQGQSWLEKQKSVEIAHVVWYKINMDIKISALSDTNKGSMYLFRLSKHYWANILIDSWYESVARENKSFCTQHIISLKNIINETESSSKFLRMRQLDLFWFNGSVFHRALTAMSISAISIFCSAIFNGAAGYMSSDSMIECSILCECININM